MHVLRFHLVRPPAKVEDRVFESAFASDTKGLWNGQFPAFTRRAHRTHQSFSICGCGLLQGSKADYNQPKEEIHRAEPGRVPDVRLRWFSPVD